MATKITPTAGNDKIPGTAQNDTVDGLAGNDILTGLAGDDSLRGGIGADSIDGGVGNDKLFGDVGNDTLLGMAGDDRLDGGADNDRLDGGAGADTLDGGTGIDTLIGGDHNDFYRVDNAQDIITEQAGTKAGSLDTVQSTVDYTLAANVENLILTGLTTLKGIGNDGINTLTGNDGNNLLDGKGGNDILRGGVGDDTLIGGTGIDQLIGGDGSDTYVVSSLEDKITETAVDGDQDVVESSVSYTLGAFLEVLTLTGANPVNGTGNDLANVLEGNPANNTLSGESGDDSLQGNGGDDTLRGGAGDDVIDGGEGIDQVVYLGQQDDYKLVYDTDENSWLIEDVNGTEGDGVDEGTDTLTGIESLVFADKGVIDLTRGLSLSINNISQIEGTGADTAFNFTVSLSAASSRAVTVNYSVQAGTATAGTDFTATSGLLTFAPDETEQTLRVLVKADALMEADETFTVILSNPVGASLVQAQATGTIQNDDQGSLSISPVSLNEGNNGSTEAVLTVSLSSAASQTVSVTYTTADATAQAGSDYTAQTGTVTFPVGSTSQQIRIPVTGDTTVEADEIFNVTLSKPVNATLTTATAAVTVKNDDQAILSIASAQITEGHAGSQNVELTISLSAPASQPVTVDFTTSNGTALAGSDYTAKTGMVTFPAGTTSQKISIPVTGDTQVEANETFTVTLGRAQNATVSSVAGTATVTLTNDDQPVISLSDVSLSEGNTAQEAVITVTLSAPSPQIVTVDYATANFSAVAGSDYTSKTGTLSFPANTTSQQIRIPVTGDTQVEADESFTVNLTNPQNATLGATKTATVTLTNDDIPLLSIAPVQIQEGNSGTTEAVITVSLSSVSSQPVTVNYGTADGTALAGSDYSPASGSLSFDPGVTSREIRLSINGDTEVEPNETLTVSLSEPQNAQIDSKASQATVTMGNDDQATTQTTPATGGTGQPATGTGGTGTSGSTTPSTGSNTPPNPFVSNGGFDNFDLDDSDNLLQGTELNDQIRGLGGNDTLDGADGDDWLEGGIGNDSLTGSNGNDTLLGGTGGDVLNGGDGNDYLEGGLFDVTDRNAAPDTLSAGEGNDTLISGAGNDNLTAGNGNNSVISGAGNDTIRAGEGNDTIDSGAGDDTINTGYGNNVVDSGAGNDQITAYYNSIVRAGEGDDRIDIGYSNAGDKPRVDAGEGADNVYFNDADNALLEGGDGDDVISGYGNGVTVLGGAGNDLVGYDEDGDTTSMEYRQSIDGGIGNDRIYAGDDNDTLNGGAGADTLAGGNGDDIFVFYPGDSTPTSRDIIQDFNTASTAEVIDLHNLIPTTLSFQGSKAFTGANQVRFALDVAKSATLVQVNLDADISTVEMEIQLVGLKGLTAGDFILATPAG